MTAVCVCMWVGWGGSVCMYVGRGGGVGMSMMDCTRDNVL